VSKLFLPHATLEEWALDERADVRDDRLSVTGESGRHPVEPAVHFLSLVAGDDLHGLVGTVKTATQLERLGAEHLEDSVVLGDAAFEVAPGYVTTLPEETAGAGSDDALSPPQKEQDLLAAFLLNKL
jgi:hypothetical protein